MVDLGGQTPRSSGGKGTMLLNELKETSDAGHTRVVAPDYATAVRICRSDLEVTGQWSIHVKFVDLVFSAGLVFPMLL